ncbi:hypothetical protein TSACC_21138 [Terrimicrobium sacchariphilum]|uniref:Outer membrane protein beta-barrel domain-containing protein n=1 Tax=Terrimicrobium sacchariphilum TaxID=690879 RepID=A0A146G767_TERSA|nr:hypothetical protein [Terrimicrobium sacchariphilum]GAT32737.1 hypothetical protein TSACC_21138 [Terrimicrobium sacchariphilum]
MNKSFWGIQAILPTCLILGCSALVAGEVPAPAAAEPTKHSFLEPVSDFVRDDVLHPVHPFEMVPGKDPNGWSFLIEPYIWAPNASGLTGFSGLPALQVNASNRTILENLKWGIMGNAEVRKGRWGLMAGGMYMELESSANLGGNLYKSGTVSLDQGVASLALAYRIIDDYRGFLDFYAGARYYYLGMSASLTTDSSGIQAVSDDITDAVAARINTRVEDAVQAIRDQVIAAIDAKKDALLAEIASNVNADLKRRLFRRAAMNDISNRADGDLARSGVDISKLDLLRNFNQGTRGAIAEYVRAVVARDVAVARGEVTSAIDSRVAAAKAKVSKELAQDIENSLPTSASNDQWWVDPILGFRGQVNFTRWLYLHAQADVGGFGAGSQIAWNIMAGLGVNFTRNVFAEVGYRYMYIDYTNSDFFYLMNFYGIYSSIGLKF